jgi:predicted Zn-dependent peptidase
VVSYQSWVHVGSVDEARWTGLAHLFEHMMFRGSKRVPGDLRDRLLRERGARGNAYTSNDVTVYFEDTSAENLPLVIELEAERFRNLEISPSVLDTERQVVLEERACVRTTIEQAPVERCSRSPSCSTYRTPTIGWQKRRRWTSACLEFFRAYYVPNNVVISIAGDFDADDAIARIRKHYGSWERGAEPPRNPTEEPEQQGERRGVVHLPVRAPLVGAAWHAPKTVPPDGPALDMLGDVLSPGRTIRQQLNHDYEQQQALSAYGGCRSWRTALLRRRRRPARRVAEPGERAVYRDRAAASGPRAQPRRQRLVSLTAPAHRQRPRLGAPRLLAFGRTAASTADREGARSDRRRRPARGAGLPPPGAAHGRTCPAVEPPARAAR